VWIAFRHNDYDMYEIWIDDVTINAEGGDTPVDPVDPTPTPNASVRGVEIFRDGEWIAEVAAPAQTFTDIEPGEVGEYEIRVVYNGNLEDYTHYTMSCPEIVVPVENICIAPENLEVIMCTTTKTTSALSSTGPIRKLLMANGISMTTALMLPLWVLANPSSGLSCSRRQPSSGW
jgi:hypothetical protein